MDLERNYIKNKLNDLNNIDIDKIYKMLKYQDKELQGNNTDSNLNIKYNIMLKLINKILESGNLQPVLNLCDFIRIDSSVIIDETINIINEMKNEIFAVFDKEKKTWYTKTKVSNYILKLLRTLCNECGFDFISIEKSVMKKGLRTYSQVYTIQKK